MATQIRPTKRKARWSAPLPRPSPSPQPQPYRRRRPEATALHHIVREHLETYLTLANESDPMGDGVPVHVENEFRSYLKWGILAHGFGRARCSSWGNHSQVGLESGRWLARVFPGLFQRSLTPLGPAGPCGPDSLKTFRRSPG